MKHLFEEWVCFPQCLQGWRWKHWYFMWPTRSKCCHVKLWIGVDEDELSLKNPTFWNWIGLEKLGMWMVTSLSYVSKTNSILVVGDLFPWSSDGLEKYKWNLCMHNFIFIFFCFWWCAIDQIWTVIFPNGHFSNPLPSYSSSNFLRPIPCPSLIFSPF